MASTSSSRTNMFTRNNSSTWNSSKRLWMLLYFENLGFFGIFLIFRAIVSWKCLRAPAKPCPCWPWSSLTCANIPYSHGHENLKIWVFENVFDLRTDFTNWSIVPAQFRRLKSVWRSWRGCSDTIALSREWVFFTKILWHLKFSFKK